MNKFRVMVEIKIPVEVYAIDVDDAEQHVLHNWAELGLPENHLDAEIYVDDDLEDEEDDY